MCFVRMRVLHFPFIPPPPSCLCRAKTASRAVAAVIRDQVVSGAVKKRFSRQFMFATDQVQYRVDNDRAFGQSAARMSMPPSCGLAKHHTGMKEISWFLCVLPWSAVDHKAWRATNHTLHYWKHVSIRSIQSIRSNFSTSSAVHVRTATRCLCLHFARRVSCELRGPSQQRAMRDLDHYFNITNSKIEHNAKAQ